MKRVAFVLAVGCGHPASSPPAQPVAVEASCAYGLLAMYAASSASEPGSHDAFTAANAAAIVDYDAASAAAGRHQMLGAARRFLACAQHYRDVADEDPGHETAVKNAGVCYENALLTFEMAGHFADEGRAALEHAAAEDRRNAELLRGKLAQAAGDCPMARPR